MFHDDILLRFGYYWRILNLMQWRRSMFHGSIVAIVTPMKEDGSIDLESLRRLLDWHIDNSTDGIVVLGTTGESPTVEFNERELIIKTALEQVAGRVPVIVGTGANSTKEAVHLTLHAMELGVDACLLVTPYYNKPTQEGLYQHYKTVAEKVAIPQILYNVPGRTGCDLLPETIGRLSSIPNIIGVKDASGHVERVGEILNLCDKEIDIFSGEDIVGMEVILAGGKGVISVTANVAPHAMHEMCAAALKGDRATAQQLNDKLIGLHKQLFIESNPIPAKWALHIMGMIPTGIRLPLTVLSQDKREPVRQAMQQAGIL
jgi:4-hydroxy-tetrahydrodipicolinate synthase